MDNMVYIPVCRGWSINGAAQWDVVGAPINKAYKMGSDTVYYNGTMYSGLDLYSTARPKWCRAPQKPFTRTCRVSDLIASFYRQRTRIFMLSVAKRPFTSVLAWYKGVQAVILSALLFFFWFFSALFKASK